MDNRQVSSKTVISNLLHMLTKLGLFIEKQLSARLSWIFAAL
jgi:DNA-binding CsgD family transcriptional regulator